MVILGADLHKRSHTVVVIDTTGRKLAEKRVAATAEGHLELRRWAYLDRRRQAGDTKTEAIRALRRRLSDDVYRRLQADEAVRSTELTAAA
jgi:transposase